MEEYMEEIDFNDWEKVELRVGRIIKAEDIEIAAKKVMGR